MDTTSKPGSVRSRIRSAPVPSGWAGRASRSALRGIGSLFMPALCIHCRADRWGGTPLCIACLRKAEPLRPPVCAACGLPGCAAGHSGGEGETPMRFLFRMGPQLSTLIHGFKYRHMRRHIRFLCAYLRYRPDLAAWAASFDALVPVPIHSVRERERGYNQAAEIARETFPYLRLPVIANALKRTRATVSQTKLNREDRQANLEKAFACGLPESIRGKRLLLVDDVYTTGATVGRCAELLLEAGAAAVGVLALARVEASVDVDDFALEMEAVSGYAG
jgi:ComF family protein